MAPPFYLAFFILSPFMLMALGKEISLKTSVHHIAQSMLQASACAFPDKVKVKDKQLEILNECEELFMPKNEHARSALKSAVRDAVKELPEGGDEIVVPEEYFKILEDYKFADKSVGKPIQHNDTQIKEIWEEHREKQYEHMGKYSKFIKALKAKMPSVQAKLNLIMETKQICVEMDKNVALPNEKKDKCKKLYDDFDYFYRSTGIIKDHFVGPSPKQKKVNILGLGLQEDLEEDSEDRKVPAAKEWTPSLLAVREVPPSPQQIAQERRAKIVEQRRRMAEEYFKRKEKSRQKAEENRQISERKNVFKLSRSTMSRQDPLASSGTGSADIVEEAEHIGSQLGHSASAPDSPAAAEVLLLPNGQIDLSRNGSRDDGEEKQSKVNFKGKLYPTHKSVMGQSVKDLEEE